MSTVTTPESLLINYLTLEQFEAAITAGTLSLDELYIACKDTSKITALLTTDYAEDFGTDAITSETTTTYEGILKGSGGAIAVAEQGTDYAIPSMIFSVVVPTTGWSASAPYTITINVDGMLSSYNPIVALRVSDDASVRAEENVAFACISKVDTYDGSIVVTCDSAIPEHEVTLRLITTTNTAIVNEVNAENVVGLSGLLENKYNKPLRFVNISVTAASWVADTTYTDYAFKCDIALTGVTASMIPDVVLPLEIAVGGEVAPIAETGAGYVRLYASAAQADMTIPTITVWKEV